MCRASRSRSSREVTRAPVRARQEDTGPQAVPDFTVTGVCGSDRVTVGLRLHARGEAQPSGCPPPLAHSPDLVPEGRCCSSAVLLCPLHGPHLPPALDAASRGPRRGPAKTRTPPAGQSAQVCGPLTGCTGLSRATQASSEEPGPRPGGPTGAICTEPTKCRPWGPRPRLRPRLGGLESDVGRR